jgi:hypothetical protein
MATMRARPNAISVNSLQLKLDLMMTPDEYDPPSYGGTVTQEAHAEMTLLFGAEKPTQAWILTDFDVWERNPFYEGPPQPHPEDDDHW